MAAILIALVIDAVNVILRQLGELPEGPETRELRDAALGCIEEVVMWNVRRPPVEVRDALMKKVLALHVTVRKASGAASPAIGLPPITPTADEEGGPATSALTRDECLA